MRKAINEKDLYELSSENVRKENAVLIACKKGRGNGEKVLAGVDLEYFQSCSFHLELSTRVLYF